jgi:hypothetical protein
MMMPVWRALHPIIRPEHLGFLPGMLDDEDPRPAREQFDANYQHGGGWRPFTGYRVNPDGSLSYPGDPPIYPLAMTMLRDERIMLYEHSWVGIFQPDGSAEIARMD